jgi:hypothetical protein
MYGTTDATKLGTHRGGLRLCLAFASVLAAAACDGSTGLLNEPVPLDDALLHYTGDRCFAVIPGRTTDAKLDTLPFTCGVIIIGFSDSTRWDNIQDLVHNLGGRTGNRFPSSGEYVFHVDFYVPVGREKQAIEKARKDPRVTYAELLYSIRVGVP